MPAHICSNCATTLQGGWCHLCGQAEHDFHRSTWHLAGEAFENFFHADSRLWRTLTRLVRNPGRLTHDYLAGKRAPQIPPLRLFLTVLLVLALVGGWATSHISLSHIGKPPADVEAEIAASHAEVEAEIAAGHVELGLPRAWEAAATSWVRTHVSLAVAHPDDLLSAVRDRAQNFAFLMLPISALLLAVIFVARRGFVLFDHLVFSMHSLSFQGLLISTALLTGQAWLLWAAPVHLFAHLRGVYATGVVGTLARMAVLAMLSTVAFSLLLVGLIVAGLRVMHG